MARRLCAIAMILVAPAVRAGTFIPSGLPAYGGDLSVAAKIIHGDAHVVILGDSITQDIQNDYSAQWSPDHWSGLVMSQSLPSGQFFVPNTILSSQYLHSTDGAPGPAGISQGPPGGEVENTFNGSAATNDSNIFANRFYGLGLGVNYGGFAFKTGQWANTNQGTLTFTALTYANPNGAADGQVQMVIRADANGLGVVPINGNNSATNHIVGTTYTVNASTFTDGLATDFKLAAGASPTAGSNVSVAGVRVTNGQSGLQLASIAQSGHNAAYYATDQSASPADLAQFVTLTDSNVALLAFGANDYGNEDSAAFKQNILTIIGRYRAARPNMKIVLVSPYDETRGQSLDSDGVTQLGVAYDKVLYQIANEQPGVLFLNQYDAAGAYDTLNGTYLGDGLHPNAAGGNYFATEQWGLLAGADAASVPEPTTVSIIAGCGMFLLRRRKRLPV